MMINRLVLILSMLTLLPQTDIIIAQDKQFTLEDLNFGGNNYRNMVPKNKYHVWWGDELVRLDVEECFLVNKDNGKETSLFKLEDVNNWMNLSEEESKVRSLLYLSFPYPGKPIVKIDTHGKQFLLDFKTHKVEWADDASGVGRMGADWSSSSKSTAYVGSKDNQLWISDGSNNKTKQLTKDGSREIVYGQSVHRNEFGIEKGTFWSPDGTLLAFYRMDQSMVTDYPQVNITFLPEKGASNIATYEPDKYPMAGETSHIVTVGVYNQLTGKTIYLNTPKTDGYKAVTNESNNVNETCYFTNITWSPDSRIIYMFELNRDQNDCRLVSYDAQTGERLKELYRETSTKYVEPLHPIVFLPWDDSQYIMQSQKDGYNHLYLCSADDGRIIRQLTSGPWVVMDLLGFNTADKSVIISSNEKSPIQRNTYAVSLKNGKRTLLDNGKGYHYAELSSSGQWMKDSWSEPDVPRMIAVVKTSNRSSRLLFEADDPWKEYKKPEYVSGCIKAADGETDLFYRMVKPVDFDPTKKYPTIIYVYGGPHAHNVDARWNYCSRGWETYMAQKGYLMFILDNRGSENRGRDFEQATFRQLGQIEMQDQIKGVEFLKSLPYVDANRIGVHGWSFGGFMTISLMTNYPDIFKVGVAGGPVIDWKWYEVMYGERYMDTPQQNPDGYAKTSLLSMAKNLKGKLQIISGYNDNTVVPQHCLSFIYQCNLNGTQPDLYIYPGEGHNMRGHQSTHLHERISQYFDDYLK